MLEFEGPIPREVVPGYSVVVIGVLVQDCVLGGRRCCCWRCDGKSCIGVGGDGWSGDGYGAGNVRCAVLAEVLSV